MLRLCRSACQKKKQESNLSGERFLQVGGNSFVAFFLSCFSGRLFGTLAISRAFGDGEMKVPKQEANYVSCVPFIKKMELNAGIIVLSPFPSFCLFSPAWIFDSFWKMTSFWCLLVTVCGIK